MADELELARPAVPTAQAIHEQLKLRDDSDASEIDNLRARMLMADRFVKDAQTPAELALAQEVFGLAQREFNIAYTVKH